MLTALKTEDVNGLATLGSPQNSQEFTIPNFTTTLHLGLSLLINYLFILMAHVQGSWQIECSCKNVVNFVMTLVLVMPPSSLSLTNSQTKERMVIIHLLNNKLYNRN